MELKGEKSYQDGFWEKYWLWIIAGGIVVTVWLLVYLYYLPDGQLRLVFCDVGQGDGIYLDLPDGKDVLIDGGPNKRILQCLGRNMPFWDRKLELVVLTHPQADHLNGLIDVVRRFRVDRFVLPSVGNRTEGYKQLVEAIKTRKIKVDNAYSGDKIRFKPRLNWQLNPKLWLVYLRQKSARADLDKEVIFRVLWPSREFVQQNTNFIGGATIAKKSTHVRAKFSNSAVLGAGTTAANLNDFSQVLEVKFGQFEALLTGDADANIQDEIIQAAKIEPVELLKVPHHGARIALSAVFLRRLKPQVAVISVGENNRWGHPKKETLQQLKSWGVKIWRTDNNGAVKVTTNGKQFKVTSDK